MVKIPMRVGVLGQKFFWEQAELIRIPVQVGGIGLEFFREWVGLVRIPSGEDVLGQNSFRSGWDWSEFLVQHHNLHEEANSAPQLVYIQNLYQE